MARLARALAKKANEQETLEVYARIREGADLSKGEALLKDYERQDEQLRASKRDMLDEASEQKRLIAWARACGLLCHRVALGDGVKSAMAGARAKRLGDLAGVSDLVVITPANVLYVEMKKQSKQARLSKVQKAFFECINSTACAKAVVAYGAVEAINLIKKEVECILEA